MSHFQRSSPAPSAPGGYRGLKQYVRADFRCSCAYCLLDELFAAGPENFEIDHFRPKSIFKDQEHDFYNLYWSCHPCNFIKKAQWPSSALEQAGIGFVDLCENEFADHFVAHTDGSWEGLTAQARYTIDALRLNRKHLLTIRVLIRQLDEAERDLTGEE